MIWDRVTRADLPERTKMTNTNDTPTGKEALDLVEIEAEGVDEDGDVVIDDVVAAVDGDGNIVAVDETIAVLAPDGDVVVDEIISVVGDDGELHVAEEDITVLEADGEA